MHDTLLMGARPILNAPFEYREILLTEKTNSREVKLRNVVIFDTPLYKKTTVGVGGG